MAVPGYKEIETADVFCSYGWRLQVKLNTWTSLSDPRGQAYMCDRCGNVPNTMWVLCLHTWERPYVLFFFSRIDFECMYKKLIEREIIADWVIRLCTISHFICWNSARGSVSVASSNNERMIVKADKTYHDALRVVFRFCDFLSKVKKIFQYLCRKVLIA